MKNPILLFYAFFGLSFFALSAIESPYEVVGRSWQTKKQMTFLVYIAGDNDLASFIPQDLNEMKSIGSNSRLNILVYLNTKTPAGKKVTRKLVILKGKTLQVGDEESRDSGQAESVIEACKWAHRDFPSEQFALVLWDHGSGSLNRSSFGRRGWLWDAAESDEHSGRAVCYDDTTGNYLTDQKLIDALSIVCAEFRGGKKIDILAFDACLMADIEVAYTVAPYAKFMVASQETIPGNGYGYKHLLQEPAKKKLSSFDFARAMTKAYQKEYQSKDPSYTLSALDLSRVNKVVSNINQVSRLLKELLEDDADGQIVRDIIHEGKDSRNCLQFSEEAYLDINHFYRNVGNRLNGVTLKNESKKSQLLGLLQSGQEIIRSCVIANVVGRTHAGACGLSVYFGRTAIDYTYPQLKWSHDTQWLPFLQAYGRE